MHLNRFQNIKKDKHFSFDRSIIIYKPRIKVLLDTASWNGMGLETLRKIKTVRFTGNDLLYKQFSVDTVF